MSDTLHEMTQRYTRQGCPTADELIAAQGLGFPRDPHDLLGDFWPQEESIDEFLDAMHEWRGPPKTDPAA